MVLESCVWQLELDEAPFHHLSDLEDARRLVESIPGVDVYQKTVWFVCDDFDAVAGWLATLRQMGVAFEVSVIVAGLCATTELVVTCALTRDVGQETVEMCVLEDDCADDELAARIAESVFRSGMVPRTLVLNHRHLPVAS